MITVGKVKKFDKRESLMLLGSQFIAGDHNLGFGANASYDFVIFNNTKDLIIENVEVVTFSEKFYLEFFVNPTFDSAAGDAIELENMSMGSLIAPSFEIKRNPSVTADGSDRQRLVSRGLQGFNTASLGTGGLNAKARFVPAGTPVLVKISNRGDATGDVTVNLLITELD